MMALDEAKLAEHFRAQAEDYAQALRCAEAALSVLTAGEDAEPALQEMQQWLTHTARRDAATATLREAWQAEGKRAGAELRQAVQHVTGLMTRLLELTQQLEHQAAARRDQFLPELDALRRGQKMQRAYGQAVHFPKR